MLTNALIKFEPQELASIVQLGAMLPEPDLQLVDGFSMFQL